MTAHDVTMRRGGAACICGWTVAFPMGTRVDSKHRIVLDHLATPDPPPTAHDVTLTDGRAACICGWSLTWPEGTPQELIDGPLTRHLGTLPI